MIFIVYWSTKLCTVVCIFVQGEPNFVKLKITISLIALIQIQNFNLNIKIAMLYSIFYLMWLYLKMSFSCSICCFYYPSIQIYPVVFMCLCKIHQSTSFGQLLLHFPSFSWFHCAHCPLVTWTGQFLAWNAWSSRHRILWWSNDPHHPRWGMRSSENCLHWVQGSKRFHSQFPCQCRNSRKIQYTRLGSHNDPRPSTNQSTSWKNGFNSLIGVFCMYVRM